VLVDTHIHVVSRDPARYPFDPRPGTDPWFRDVPHDVDDLLVAMDGAGVDRGVLVQAVGAYRYDNRYVVDAAGSHADRCTSVVCLDVEDADTPARLDELATARGVGGLRWWGIDGAPFDAAAVWQALAATGASVVVTCLADRLEELAGALPRPLPVPVALDHCGFADLSRGAPETLRELAACPGLLFKVSTIVLDGLAEHGDVREGLADLVDAVGADRVLWGSDYSQTHDRTYPELVELARHASGRLADDARDAFLGANAARVYFGSA
jgi:L-fuconolactonase